MKKAKVVFMEPIQYQLIARADALRSALAHLKRQHSLALDLEMENQRHHYGLHIALIQISAADGQNFVFDPLAGIDLAPLQAIFSDQRIEKIVHDADFDRRACRQVYGVNLVHVFDTKIAAQLCGFRKFGLASLLQDLLNIQTNKKFQKMDWLKRPLQKDALDYAAHDTAHLHAIKTMLERKLAELGRLGWAQEEFRHAEMAEPAPDLTPIHHRIKQSALLNARQLAILGALVPLRDEIARSVNRPVHFIIRNDLLLRLATDPPATIEAFRQIKSMHPVIYREQTARRVLDAIRKGLSAPEETHTHFLKKPRSKGGFEQRLKAMQAWRALAAAPFGLEPYLLLSNDVLQWAARHPDQAMPGDIAGQIHAWQRKIAWDPFKKQFLTPADTAP